MVGDLKEENLVNDFKKCGIYPLDCNQLLSRLPYETNSQEANQRVDECLINMLKSASGEDDAAPKRGKKLIFSPGKAISVSADSNDTESEDESSDESLDTESSSNSSSD